MKKAETKSEFFKRVAERRTKEIIHKIEILGNCASRSNYEYTKEDIKKIFNAIEVTANDTRKLFRRRDDADFTL